MTQTSAAPAGSLKPEEGAMLGTTTRDPIVLAWNAAHPELVAGAILRCGGRFVRSLGYARGGYVNVAECAYDQPGRPAVTVYQTVASVAPTGQSVR